MIDTRCSLFFLYKCRTRVSLAFASSRSWALVILVDGVCFQRSPVVRAITRELKGMREGKGPTEKSEKYWGFISHTRLLVTFRAAKTLSLTESAKDRCRSLISHLLPLVYHGPCTCPQWGYTKMYLWLPSDQCQNHEQAHEVTRTATQHQDDGACKYDCHWGRGPMETSDYILNTL